MTLDGGAEPQLQLNISGLALGLASESGKRWPRGKEARPAAWAVACAVVGGGMRAREASGGGGARAGSELGGGARGKRAWTAARGREASWVAARAGSERGRRHVGAKRAGRWRARELPVGGGEAVAHRIWEEQDRQPVRLL